MKKIIFIFGTRPEVIKLAPLILECKKNKNIETVLCNTEQQKQLSHQTLSFFNLKSDINLDVMRENQTLAAVQSRIMNELEKEFQENSYDGAFVQGDTITVLSSSLVCFYNKIPLFYVEAGLRSHNLNEPFPEEALRQMVSRITTFNFTPTKISFDNLLRDGIEKETIHMTGNTVVDALFCLDENTQRQAKQYLTDKNIDINGDFVLITCHRRENHGDRIDRIIEAIKLLASKFKNTKFIIPVHPNLNVKTKIHARLSNVENIILLEPLDYPVLVELQKNAKLILTDSGGIQEEAPTFGCPILVLRYETERPDGVEAGFAKLVGADIGLIVEESTKILNRAKVETRILNAKNPYGDGTASRKIMNIVNNFLNNR